MSLKDLSVEDIQELLENATYTYSAYRGRDANGDIIWQETPGVIEGDWHIIESIADNLDEPWHVDGLGIVSLVDSFGGEGQGDDYWMVLSITSGDVTRYFKMSGYHVSHDGSYYEGPFEEVNPKQETITVWR